MTADRIQKIAAHRYIENQEGRKYKPLPAELAPDSLDEAYAAMEQLRDLWVAGGRGPIGGYKIALTSKPIQELVGVDQPCGGFVFASTIHPSPAQLSLANFGRLAFEFELAVRIGREMPADKAPWTADSVRNFIDGCFPAFELIDDRNAEYKDLSAIGMLTDNVWCGGVVVGPADGDWKSLDFVTTPVAMSWNGKLEEESVTGAAMGNPLESLAWLANLAAERGWPMQPGMTVITGSTLATRHPEPGDTVAYTVEGLGTVEAAVSA